MRGDLGPLIEHARDPLARQADGLRRHAEELLARADQVDRMAAASETLVESLDRLEGDVALFVRKRLGRASYTYAVVRYDAGGVIRWAITGRSDRSRLTTSDLIGWLAEGTTEEVWYATGWESLT